MGVVPSRETLLRGLVRDASSVGTRHLDYSAVQNRKNGSGGVQDILLVPLTADYFPSADSRMFQLFLSVCREDPLFLNRTGGLFDTVGASYQDSDAGIYDFFMSVSRQRLFQTDSELLAVHRRGRVFSPVPCAVALVRESVRPQSPPATLLSHTSPWSVVSPLELDSLSGVYMIGFIGDTGFCPSSLPQNMIKSIPFKFGLFLSTKVGGNLRLSVTCLATHTFIAQLRRIGIVETPAAFGSLESVYDTPDVHEYDDLENPMNDVAVEEKAVAGDGQEGVIPTNWVDANVSGNVVFRPIEFKVEPTNVPWMCYLRELRALIGACTAESKESSGKTQGLLLGEEEFTKRSLVTFLDGNLLRGAMDGDQVKKAVEWAYWCHETGLSHLTGSRLVDLRAALREESMKCIVKGRVYMDSVEPFHVQDGDVWIVGSDGFTYEKATGEYTRLAQGSILIYDGDRWCIQKDLFAEDILLSVCREECQLARKAGPDDPHWIRDAEGSLAWGEGGFCRWMVVKNGLTLVYTTVPKFSKQTPHNAHNPSAAFRKNSRARPISSECGSSANPVVQESLNSHQRRRDISPRVFPGGSLKSSSLFNSSHGKQAVGSRRNSISRWWASTSPEDDAALFSLTSSKHVGAQPKHFCSSSVPRSAKFSSPLPVSRSADFHAPQFSLSSTIPPSSLPLQPTHAAATAPLRAQRSSMWRSAEARTLTSMQTGTLVRATTDEVHLIEGTADTPGTSVGSSVRSYDRQGKYRWNWGRPSP